MEHIHTAQAMQEQAFIWRRQDKTVALVPTMGYWHEGHLSLVRWAREQCEVLVASIFVNPTQFAPGEDLDSYPANLARDAELASKAGVDVLFYPSAASMYAPDHGTWITVPDLAQHLCGRTRPTHFRGVATVVCKLFNLVLPTLAVFGEKDWQQLAIIRKMTLDLNLPVQVVGRPIMREADGLAMSSRNVYLAPQERTVAPHIQKGLVLLHDLIQAGERSASSLRAAVLAYYREHIPTGELDYLELVDPARIEPVTGQVRASVVAAVAMRLGQARLIDNRYITLEA